MYQLRHFKMKDILNISSTYLKMKIKYMQEEIQNFENAISGNE